MRSVGVLADDGDAAVAVVEAWIDHDALTDREAVPGDDDSGAVCAEDARLRYRRQASADPDVEVVERGGA